MAATMPHDNNSDTEQPMHEMERSRLASESRILIGAAALDTLSFEDAVQWVLKHIEKKGAEAPVRIVCPNASLVVLADADEAYAKMLRACELVVPDGLPLIWAASLLGTPLPEQIRGVDLMEAICLAGGALGMSFYILGGLPGAAEGAAKRLMLWGQGLRLAGTDCPPFGFEADPSANQRVWEKIVAARPDFLIVALGSPKQERWISENYRGLPVGAIQGVGAAIDTVAGLRRRPPLWTRRFGLEWLGRLIYEPRRLWRRYLFGNARFLYIVFRQWLKKRRSSL
jgi:N-acetylglucosaminyldiphosphoundecaprenol N-acetyl-beta-D-mannosaminyltransferase